MFNQSIAIMKKFFTLVCFGLLAAIFAIAPGWGAEKAAVPGTITMDFSNEPLRSVLGKIAKTTRWKIKAPDKWLDKPVTQALHKATMDEGLRSILNSIGIENKLLMYDEKMKVVTVFDTALSSQKSGARLPAQASSAGQPPTVSSTGASTPKLQSSENESVPIPLRGLRRFGNQRRPDND